jgi:UDP-N-acetylglucosamine acyltransferase
MPKIHPQAAIDPKASLADDVEIGPFCVVGPDVTIGPGCRLVAHVSILGRTTVGARNVFYPNSVIGAPPQDKKYKDEPTGLIIGDDNQIRESVTLHAGTIQDKRSGGITRLGSGNLMMVNSHLGHDCQFGNNNIVSNNVMVAGHVLCGNNAVILGGTGVHHFVTIGDFAFIAGMSRIHHDVPPYVKVSDDDVIRGLNAVGLRRAGFADDDIKSLEIVVRKLFVTRDKPFSITLAEYANGKAGDNPLVKQIVDFLQRRDEGKHGRYLEALRHA